MNPNNLNVLRLIGASLVLYGHSFVFLGLREPLFLSWSPLGPLGVYIFFTISGYLITQSSERAPHLLRFFARRALRIFPGLIVCSLLSVLILGPALTTLPLQDYFENQYTWQYLRNIGLYIGYYLPGVFESNRVPNAVNGSLWSLPVEFLMYIVVATSCLLRGNRWVFAALAVISAVITLFWAQSTTEMVVVYAFDLRQAFICGTYFWVGAVFYKFDLKRFFSLSAAVIACVVILCLEPWAEVLRVVAWVLLPTIVLAFGLSYSPMLNKLTCSGDYSYGIYIYAFPIQQTVVYLYPQMPLSSYLPLCFTLALLCAILSWHLVEQPSLALRPRNPKPTSNV
jgi:peptidoglycan/LPS O-acetylase OafA/YrhL